MFLILLVSIPLLFYPLMMPFVKGRSRKGDCLLVTGAFDKPRRFQRIGAMHWFGAPVKFHFPLVFPSLSNKSSEGAALAASNLRARQSGRIQLKTYGRPGNQIRQLCLKRGVARVKMADICTVICRSIQQERSFLYKILLRA